MTTLDFSSLSPFSSFVVAASKTKSGKAKNLLANIKSAITRDAPWVSDTDLVPPTTAGVTNTYAFHLVEDRTAPWAGSNPIKDRLNHLVACFVENGFAAIYISDPELKNQLHNALVNEEIAGWLPVNDSILVTAYIRGSALKTLWLGGAHRNVSIKADSKILTGTNLADAIDPFGDSTFVAGAAKSAKAGVSLKRSGVWFGPNTNWLKFSTTAQMLLHELQAAKSVTSSGDALIHAGLARNIYSFSGVGPAYHVEWAAPETMKGNRRRGILENLISNYEISLSHGKAGKKKNFILDIVYKAKNINATFTVEPSIAFHSVIFKVTGVAATPSDFSDCIKQIQADPSFLRVFYDCGHSISNATLSAGIVQDRDFSLKFCDFAPAGSIYNVAKEKPHGNPPPLQDMFKTSDDSLFKWVFKEGLTQLNLPLPSPGICWLYCDDGSGEVADFIHIFKPATGTPAITLIHVKGANSKSSSRRISPSAYEVVTGQAMKNLRRMHSFSLRSEIENCVSKHGLQRVWDEPWSLSLTTSAKAPAAMLAAIKNITAQCDYEVIIVQPHVTKSQYMPGGKQQTNAAAQQLRSLLSGAEVMAKGASARFRVVADNS